MPDAKQDQRQIRLKNEIKKIKLLPPASLVCDNLTTTSSHLLDNCKAPQTCASFNTLTFLPNSSIQMDTTQASNAEAGIETQVQADLGP